MKDNAKVKISYLATSDLIGYENNPKQHPDSQIRSLRKSIENFGFINPIVIDEHHRIVAGHGRWQAACELKLNTVPCIQVNHLSEAQVRAYRIADNKLAENAEWDSSLLTVELAFLQNLDVNYDFDTLGFDAIEIDTHLHHPTEVSRDDNLDYLPTPSRRPVSQTGDVFHLGPHRVGCGDCRDAVFLRRLMKNSRASVCITDPPYNVSIPGNARGTGGHDDFMMASGEMSVDEFRQFLSLSLLNLKRVTQDGSLFYVFMDWRHLRELFAATDGLFTEMINLCVWNKSNGGMGSFYRSKHELIGVFKHGRAPHLNNVQLGKFGRDRCNVWDCPGLSSFGKNRESELAMHPTVKPVALLKDILLDCTKPNDIVIDGFLGSGSTLMAAERTRRRCFGVEIDPGYVDVILQRFLEATGTEPVHVSTGMTYSQLCTDRLEERRDH